MSPIIWKLALVRWRSSNNLNLPEGAHKSISLEIYSSHMHFVVIFNFQILRPTNLPQMLAIRMSSSCLTMTGSKSRTQSRIIICKHSAAYIFDMLGATMACHSFAQARPPMKDIETDISRTYMSLWARKRNEIATAVERSFWAGQLPISKTWTQQKTHWDHWRVSIGM